jgi:putative transposase
LTHRCHDRQFLFRFAKDRNGCRRRLRKAARGLGVSILTYQITSNPVHVVAYAADPEAIATLMQQAAGELARDYNRRKPNGPKPLPWGSEHLSRPSRIRSNRAD